jgi:hypothetical protein
MVHAACRAHARRKFFHAVELNQEDQRAICIVAQMDKLFEIDEKARQQRLSQQDRHALRLEKAKHKKQGFLKQIERETPKELALHLIVDNYATHKHPAVQQWLKAHDRFYMHFTPTGSLWMNLVERFFGELTCEVVREGSFQSLRELVRAIESYLAERNQNPKKYVWRASGEFSEHPMSQGGACRRRRNYFFIIRRSANTKTIPKKFAR